MGSQAKTVASIPSISSRFDLKQHPLLETFNISDTHLRTPRQCKQAGEQIIAAFRRDGIINISVDGICDPEIIRNAHSVQKAFFSLPLEDKMACSNDKSYGGYVYSGEEDTGGKPDAAEIFTVLPDFAMHHPLVQQSVPCHGPVPWPFPQFEYHMKRYMSMVRSVGDKILPLIALGLGMEREAFAEVTKDSYGHMRVLKFCEKGSRTRGIGSHTDYGMVVIASQDHVGGLWARPPLDEKRVQNWKESSAGQYQNYDGWKFIVPEPNVLTCFPGDMLQFITKDHLVSTPHMVELAEEVRYALAYFHEPSFGAIIRRADTGEQVHYGEHITKMLMRCYPEKPTTERIVQEDLKTKLPEAVTGTYTF